MEQTFKSCVHIYCGDGKGKTSAAMGLAVRAAGRGKRVLVVRFLKSDDSGEVKILGEIPGIRVKQKKEAGEYYDRMFHSGWEEAVRENFDMVIFDEIMAACKYGLVCEKEVLDHLKKRPRSLEVVLTGRDPSPEFVDLADYVSEIRKVKHPFDQGCGAREGIEF